jgi:hypothetical protein
MTFLVEKNRSGPLKTLLASFLAKSVLKKTQLRSSQDLAPTRSMAWQSKQSSKERTVVLGQQNEDLPHLKSLALLLPASTRILVQSDFCPNKILLLKF